MSQNTPQIEIPQEIDDYSHMVFYCEGCLVEIIEDTDEWDNADWRLLICKSIVLCGKCKSPNIPTKFCCKECSNIVVNDGECQGWVEADWENFEKDGTVICMDCQYGGKNWKK